MSIIKVSTKHKHIPEKPNYRVIDRPRVIKKSSLTSELPIPTPVEAAPFSSDEQVRESAIRKIQDEWNIRSDGEQWRVNQNNTFNEFERIFGSTLK